MISQGIGRTALLIFAVLCAKAMAEDWPALAGPHGNWTSTDSGLADAWPKEGPKVLWEAREVGAGFGSPVVAGGKVFVIHRPIDSSFKDKHGNIPTLNEAKFLPGPDVLSCFDKLTGKLIWKHEFNSLTTTTATAWNTPTVEGDAVYARGGDGQVRCISTQDGACRWVWPKQGEAPFSKADGKNMGLVTGVATAPGITLCDGMLILLGGHNGYRSVLVGLDKKTGEKMWEHTFSDWIHGANNYTVLNLGTRRAIVVFGEVLDPKTGEKLCGYEASNGGMTCWSRAWNDTQVFSGCPRAKSGHGEGLICNKFKINSDGSVACDELWKWIPAMTDAQADQEKLEKSFGGPLFVDGYIYVFMGRKGEGSCAYCIDAATGKDMWPERAKTSNGFISPIYADKKIYYSDMRGKLLMFAANPKQYQPLASAQALEPGWSSPVLSDGCLFSRGEQGVLKCLDLKKN